MGRLADGRTLFVPRSAPGDRVEVRLTESHARYARGLARRLLRGGPERVQPPCPVASECGGCAWQHLSYPAQVQAKSSFLTEALRRVGGVQDPPVLGVLPAASPFAYRNKAQVPAEAGPDGACRLGYYREGSHQVVPLPAEGCRLLAPAVDRALCFARDHLAALKLRAYDPAAAPDGLRHVMARAGTDGSALLVLVTAGPLGAEASRAAASWVGQAGIVGVLNNVQPKGGNVILGQETRLIAGEERLEEVLDGLRYRLSATSFFQVNPAQASVLVGVLLGARAWAPTDRVLELFCGVGTLSLPLARLGLRLHGVESHAAAVEDARANAGANGLGGASFAVADAAEAWGTLPPDFAPDVVVLDPPRKGLDAPLAERLAKDGPADLLYVSCDPASLARDVKRLAQGGYRLVSCQGVDLFPQTPHVESVSLLRRA